MTPLGQQLDFQQLSDLLDTVFRPAPGEGSLALLTDVPSGNDADNAEWAERRQICNEWHALLQNNLTRLPFTDVKLYTYASVDSNNNDLPETLQLILKDGSEGETVSLREVLTDASVVIAMTEFSATAPLKLLARELRFRGATMPGFSRAMIPSLSLEYEKIHEKVVELKKRMDQATEIDILLKTEQGEYQVCFDTRFREGHASGGLIREKGMVGNLPSGEAYIVPYEGEREGIPSRSAGTLPVQFGNEIVLYEIRQNHAGRVTSSGVQSDKEQQALSEEPAYGNIAEIGIGVLGEWGVKACGSTLLDEKLGLHVAFGRSDHFGGVTGVSSFRDSRRVVHIDRVYVPSVQPDIRVARVSFVYGEAREDIILNDALLV